MYTERASRYIFCTAKSPMLSNRAAFTDVVWRHFEALPLSPHIAAVTLNGTARWPTGSQLIGLLRSVLRAFFAEMNWSSQFLEAENDSAPAFSSQNAIVLFQLIFGVRIHGAELMRTVGILTWRGGQP